MDRNELVAALVAEGWKEHSVLMGDEGVTAFLVKRLPPGAAPCPTNGHRVAFHLRLWALGGGRYRSASVEVVAGPAGGSWWELRAYSLEWEELVDRLPGIEARLVAAWAAVAALGVDDDRAAVGSG